MELFADLFCKIFFEVYVFCLMKLGKYIYTTHIWVLQFFFDFRSWTTLEEDYILTWGAGAKTSLGVSLTKLKH
jgi:hypothetical protein